MNLNLSLLNYLESSSSSCNKTHNRSRSYEHFIVLLTSWHLLCGQCYLISVPSVWGRLRSKQLLELHQTPFPPPNTRKKAVWPRKTTHPQERWGNTGDLTNRGVKFPTSGAKSAVKSPLYLVSCPDRFLFSLPPHKKKKKRSGHELHYIPTPIVGDLTTPQG